MTMTISQGLRRIKKIKGQLGDWQRRAMLAASFVVGKEPSYDFNISATKASELRDELVKLTAAVAVANATVKITSNGSEVSLAAAIRKLQEMKGEIAFLQGLTLRNETLAEVEWESNPADYSKQISKKKVTVWKSALSEMDRDTKVTELQDSFEQLNALVEAANHSSVLPD